MSPVFSTVTFPELAIPGPFIPKDSGPFAISPTKPPPPAIVCATIPGETSPNVVILALFVTLTSPELKMY